MAALAACRHRITNFIKQICEQYSSHAYLPNLEQVVLEKNILLQRIASILVV